MMMRVGFFLSSVAALFGVLGGAPAFADWPNFRGPNHDGISAEKGFKKASAEPLRLVWERQLGSAFSSFACVGDRLYTCGDTAEQQVLHCLDAGTGGTVWQTPIEPTYRNEHGDGTRATPTVDEGRVYIQGAHGRLLCVDAETSKEVWSHTFGHKPTWGYSGSVLIEGKLAIATGGTSDGALVAFDKKTGKVVWKCGDDPAGYATPYPFTLNGKRYVVSFTGNSLIGVDAATGRLALRIPWETSWDVNAASPIFHDGYLFLTSGYTTGCGLFKLSPDSDGLKSEDVWRSKVLLNKFQSCVLNEGKLYSSDQKGLHCVDFMTGEHVWSHRRDDEASLKHGPLFLADGHVLLMTEDGQLQVAPATPDGFEPSLRAKVLSGRCWTVPVLHGGMLYARSLERIVCFDLRS